MKINIDCPLKQDEIINLLLEQQKPTYKLLGHPNNMVSQVQFEVDDIPEGVNVVEYTKRLIKSQPYGNSIALRVLEDGKFW